MMAIWLPRPDDPDGDDEPPDEPPWEQDPWESDPDPAVRPDSRENFTSDTTWSNYGELTRLRFGVASNTTFTIRESRLNIQLENLVLSEGPWFKIGPGGSMVIRNSTIEVKKRSELDTAVIIDHTQTRSQPASISRVVDLRDMDDPRLRLDLRWAQRGVSLVVAVQAEPGDELDIVDVLSGPAPVSWGDHTVKLDEYKGTTPRVVIFPNATGADWLMVANLHVYDGNWRAGDWDDLDTGHPAEDGWLCRGFVPFYESWIFGWDASALIEGEGDIIIVNSTIKAPSGLPRARPQSYTKVRGYDYEGSMNKWASSRGVHIKTWNGTVKVEMAQLDYVPLAADHSRVELNGSTFRGDADLVTLSKAEGSVVDCIFRTEDFEPGADPRDRTDKFQWGLSLENCISDDPFVIKECTFRGMELALDTSNCSVDVTGCIFQDIQHLAVWDHDGVGPMDWATLSAENDFSTLTEDLFLQSHSCIVDYEGEGKPNSTEEATGYGGGSSSFLGCDYRPIRGNCYNNAF
ncbi:MAG: hypothetical protein GQ558_03890, partial [Thermoplasmata archaeon]|nr:hypothetical protein [Thermoplasmata archaeon]